MKGFIFVHDKSWKNRLTAIKVKSIMSIAETLDHNALITYGNDITLETGECFTDVLRVIDTEVRK